MRVAVSWVEYIVSSAITCPMK